MFFLENGLLTVIIHGHPQVTLKYESNYNFDKISLISIGYEYNDYDEKVFFYDCC